MSERSCEKCKYYSKHDSNFSMWCNFTEGPMSLYALQLSKLAAICKYYAEREPVPSEFEKVWQMYVELHNLQHTESDKEICRAGWDAVLLLIRENQRSHDAFGTISFINKLYSQINSEGKP